MFIYSNKERQLCGTIPKQLGVIPETCIPGASALDPAQPILSNKKNFRV